MKLPGFISKKLVLIGVAALALVIIASACAYFFLKKTPEVPTAPEPTMQADIEKSSSKEDSAEVKEKTDQPTAPKEHHPASDASESNKKQIESQPTQKKEFSDVLMPKRDFLTIIVCDLGLNEELTELAITELPAEVVLAFTPYAKLLNRWFHPAKQVGHQLLIQLHNEQDLSDFNILSYYDGVMLMPQMPPVEDKKILEEFLHDTKIKRLLVLDHRLLFHNPLKKHALQKNIPVINTDYSIAMPVVMDGEIDILSLKGIVVVDVQLVPYLIEILQKHPHAELKKLEAK